MRERRREEGPAVCFEKVVTVVESVVEYGAGLWTARIHVWVLVCVSIRIGGK